MAYASKTRVPVERTQAEIKRILQGCGATSFGLFETADSATIGFQIDGLAIRISVLIESGSSEQVQRQRWRALLLVVKAKLEAVESGISTIEREFLAYVVLPSGRLLHEEVIPCLNQAVKNGKMPALLPDLR